MEGGGEVATEKTRIYVGGLGGGVTEDELRKTFSALGEVVAVDVVRTKGRSFAYLDFLPSSGKSLAKLFSTYNGCTWKGGKLRLEKAKEHYLLRLRREWQEESEHASKASDSCNADQSKSNDTLEKPKKPSLADKTQLRLFFPKLGKVKSLASVGIGKHKYSFQRLQVPSIPTHFCDCEEHSCAFITTNKKHSSEFENASDEINEQELNIMNTVMNKIFERENLSKQVTGKSKLVNGRGGSLNSNVELVAVENDEEDNLTDEDNLIINVATGNGDNMDFLGEMRTMMANLEPVPNRLRTSSEKPKSVQDSRKKKTTPLSKKRKSSHSEENDGSDTVIPETSRNSQICLTTQEASKTEVESGKKRLGSNSLRSLKSTWKDLIGQTSNTPFSISDIIATVPQEKEEESKGDDLNNALRKNVHDAAKKNLVRNKKRRSEGDKNELVSSVPQTTSSTLHITKEATTEVSLDTTEISIPDMVANDSQQRGEEEPRTDLDMPLTTITWQTNESDIHLSDSQQKEEEPRADDLDMPLTTIAQQFSISDVLPGASKQKEKEPRTDDLDVSLTSNVENNNLDKHENAGNQLGNSKDLKKLTEASPAKHNEDLIRTARGESWRHKSSWTQLISNTGNSSFSISQIVPNLSFEKHEQQAETLDLQLANKNLNTSTAATVNDQSPTGVVTEAADERQEVTLSPVKNTSQQKRVLSLGNLESEETCPFMRTEASMKEWKKAKSSLSGSLNKKKRPVKEST